MAADEKESDPHQLPNEVPATIISSKGVCGWTATGGGVGTVREAVELPQRPKKPVGGALKLPLEAVLRRLEVDGVGDAREGRLVFDDEDDPFRLALVQFVRRDILPDLENVV